MTGHGEGEIDHAGGCQNVLYVDMWEQRGKLLNATDCKDFPGTKFAEKTNPKFLLKQIDVDGLADSTAESRLKKYPLSGRSDSFQVMVF